MIAQYNRPRKGVSIRSYWFFFNLATTFILTVIGAVAYWLFGYAFAFGTESNGFIGHNYFALAYLPANMYSHWFFHFVFAATAATIVSGAMAERTEFKAYLVYSVFLTGEFHSVLYRVTVTY